MFFIVVFYYKVYILNAVGSFKNGFFKMFHSAVLDVHSVVVFYFCVTKYRICSGLEQVITSQFYRSEIHWTLLSFLLGPHEVKIKVFACLGSFLEAEGKMCFQAS